MGRFFKSFIVGMGGVLDLGGSSFRSSHPVKNIRIRTAEDDAEAIRGDFERVGDYMRKAMLSVDGEEQASAAAHSRLESAR